MYVFRKPTRYRPTWGTQSVQNRSQNRPMDPQSGSEIDPETTKIAPKSLLGGPSGGPWGAPRILCETVAFKVPPGISENRLFGPPRAQKGPKGPPKRFLGSTRRPRKRHLGVFCPPKTTHNKKMRSLWGALGARCTFSLRKNDNRQNGPLGSQGALGGAFGALGGPSGPFSKSRGSLEPPD